MSHIADVKEWHVPQMASVSFPLGSSPSSVGGTCSGYLFAFSSRHMSSKLVAVKDVVDKMETWTHCLWIASWLEASPMYPKA